MVKQNPTVNEHYIPQFYLRNFSADNKRIYQLDIISGKQTQDPVLIKSICYEKNLYEFKDEEGEFKSRNLVEDKLSKYERMFSGIIKSIRNRTHSEESYKSACFLSKEEKALLVLFIIIQALRHPEVINIVGKEIQKISEEKVSDIISRNTAISLCLPIYKELNFDEKNFVNYMIPFFENMGYLVGKSNRDSIYTSDNPLSLLFDDNDNLVKVVFPLSSNVALIMQPENQLPSLAKNRLIKLTKKDIKFINNTTIRMCEKWVYTKKPLDKKQIEWILRERKKANELFQHRSLHN